MVTQSCPTLCNPMSCIAHQPSLSMEFSRQEYWSGLPFPGDFPDPGIEPGSPALQAHSSPSEPRGSEAPPRNRSRCFRHKQGVRLCGFHVERVSILPKQQESASPPVVTLRSRGYRRPRRVKSLPPGTGRQGHRGRGAGWGRPLLVTLQTCRRSPPRALQTPEVQGFAAIPPWVVSGQGWGPQSPGPPLPSLQGRRMGLNISTR